MEFAERNDGVILAKIAVIISTILLCSAIIIAYLNPTHGYEASILSSTPLVVWVLIYTCFAIGIGVIIYNLARYEDNQTSKVWLLGLLILVLARFVLLYIPYIRGYLGWWEDHISYLGMTKDILAVGHVGGSNFYPITHIVFAETSLFSSLEPHLVENLSTAFMSVFFVCATYLLSGLVFRDNKYRILATLVAAGVLLTGPYNVVSAPNGLSILMLPFLFYLYFAQATDFRFGILFMIVLLMYPFFHPLSAAIVILALFILMIFKWFAPNAYSGDRSLAAKFTATAYFLFEIGVYTLWVSSFSILRRGVEQAWYQITMGIGSGQLEELGSSLDKLNIFGIDVLLLLLRLYGAEIILAIIAALGIILVLKKSSGKSAAQEIQNIAPLTVIFFVSGFLFIAFLLGLPGTQVGEGQQDRRFLGYLEVLLPIFTAFAFLQFVKFERIRKLAGALVFPVLLITMTLSYVSLYSSSFISQPNTQVTLHDMTGSKWFIENKDENLFITFVSLFPFRFSDAILGYEETHTVRFDLSHSRDALPNHFGYNDYTTLGEQFTRDRYLMMTKYDRSVYLTVWQSVGRYNVTDFQLLADDVTVSRLYSNGETMFYYVNSKPF